MAQRSQNHFCTEGLPMVYLGQYSFLLRQLDLLSIPNIQFIVVGGKSYLIKNAGKALGLLKEIPGKVFLQLVYSNKRRNCVS